MVSFGKDKNDTINASVIDSDLLLIDPTTILANDAIDQADVRCQKNGSSFLFEYSKKFFQELGIIPTHTTFVRDSYAKGEISDHSIYRLIGKRQTFGVPLK